MREYQTVEANGNRCDGDLAVLHCFPGLTQKELDQANDRFQHYIFFKNEKEGRRVWTSCCHKAGVPLWCERTLTPEHRDLMWAKHNFKIRCPWCGREVTAKCIGKIGKAKNLQEYQPIVFLKTTRNGKTIYAQGYWALKEYDKDHPETLSAYPLYMATRVYRWREGCAEMWENGYGGWTREEICFGKEPFNEGGIYGGISTYTVIGFTEIAKSFLQYIHIPQDIAAYDEKEKVARSNALMRFLHLAAQYPANVEMLLKMGVGRIIEDWIYCRKKNVDLIRWGERDPRRAFRMDGGSLKVWMREGRNLQDLEIRRVLQKHGINADMGKIVTIRKEMFERYWQDIRNLDKAFKLAKEWHSKPEDVLRYFHNNASAAWRIGVWSDYIHAAAENGVELWKKNLLFPRNLNAAHEEEVTKMNLRRDAEAEIARQIRAEEQAREWAARTEQLERRYAIEMDGLAIVVPRSEADIVNEGKILCHCVGGYVDRHIKGTLSILFLRKASAPDTPYLTIEMNGTELVQIHGYRNEGVYTTKGRFAEDPAQTYREWLNVWLAWIRRGSPRRKDGSAILRKKKTKAA